MGRTFGKTPAARASRGQMGIRMTVRMDPQVYTTCIPTAGSAHTATSRCHAMMMTRSFAWSRSLALNWPQQSSSVSTM